MDRSRSDPVLNLAGWEPRSGVNGPGERFVLWAQGCRRRCPGCFNPDFQPIRPARNVPVDELARRILQIPGLEGVTYSGGEPMLQAGPLLALSRRLRLAGLSIVCYSGETLDELRASSDPDVTALLGCLDILIDGPYREEERAALPWRGSRNQQVHLLTPRYRHLDSYVQLPRSEVEFIVGHRGFTMTGVGPRSIWQELHQRLLAWSDDGGDLPDIEVRR